MYQSASGPNEAAGGHRPASNSRPFWRWAPRCWPGIGGAHLQRTAAPGQVTAEEYVGHFTIVPPLASRSCGGWQPRLQLPVSPLRTSCATMGLVVLVAAAGHRTVVRAADRCLLTHHRCTPREYVAYCWPAWWSMSTATAPALLSPFSTWAVAAAVVIPVVVLCVAGAIASGVRFRPRCCRGGRRRQRYGIFTVLTKGVARSLRPATLIRTPELYAWILVLPDRADASAVVVAMARQPPAPTPWQRPVDRRAGITVLDEVLAHRRVASGRAGGSGSGVVAVATVAWPGDEVAMMTVSAMN